MATGNELYPLWKDAIINNSTNSDIVAGTLKAVLIDIAIYTYADGDQFESDLSGVIGTAVTLGTKVVLNGNFDSADPTWTSVSGAEAGAVVHYIDTGTPTTSRLVAYLDTGVTGLPVTPNGGDITFAVDAAGWWTL